MKDAEVLKRWRRSLLSSRRGRGETEQGNTGRREFQKEGGVTSVKCQKEIQWRKNKLFQLVIKELWVWQLSCS